MKSIYVAIPKKHTQKLLMEYIQSFSRKSENSAARDAMNEHHRTGKQHTVVRVDLYTLGSTYKQPKGKK